MRPTHLVNDDCHEVEDGAQRPFHDRVEEVPDVEEKADNVVNQFDDNSKPTFPRGLDVLVDVLQYLQHTHDFAHGCILFKKHGVQNVFCGEKPVRRPVAAVHRVKATCATCARLEERVRKPALFVLSSQVVPRVTFRRHLSVLNTFGNGPADDAQI